MPYKYSAINSVKRQYQMRECSGEVDILNHNTLMLYKDDSLFYIITNFKGFWPWAIYEGIDHGDIGENILVKIDNYEYVIIEGGGYGPYVSNFKTDEEIKFAFYAVCSGGDPGSIFALSDNWIYSLSNGYPGILKIKRDKKFELENNTDDKAKIVDLYLSLNETSTRGFGYGKTDIVNPINLIKEEIQLKEVLNKKLDLEKNLDQDVINIFNEIYKKN